MTGAETIALADIIVALLVALGLVALFSRRLAVPYTAALVVFGLLVAILVPAEAIAISPEVVLVVLVPGLVFEAAFRLDIEHVRPTLAASSLLAIPGVLVMAGLVAIVLNVAVAMPLSSAFLVGAMVSATDKGPSWSGARLWSTACSAASAGPDSASAPGSACPSPGRTSCSGPGSEAPSPSR
jgi:NhaP-type Na+/H+ or K+/H+ antiporter